MATGLASWLALYTAALTYLGYRGRRHAVAGESFLHGGRRFQGWHVFVLVTAMWAAWMSTVELETAYLLGWSAIWFGISVMAMSLLVAVILLRPFQKLRYLTSSELIGRLYGRKLRAFAGLVIAATFPIFAMSNALAAAAYLHALWGWPLAPVLIGVTAVILAYVTWGGLWSLVYTQATNLVVMTLGTVVAAWYVLHAHTPPVRGLHLPPGYFSPVGVGAGLILVWVVTNLINSVSAQAEFQAVASVPQPRVGQRAVYLSTLVLPLFVVVPVALGIAARLHVPGHVPGLVAFPLYFARVAPPWAVLAVAAAMWASALTWCGPLMFSGASSFGLDTCCSLLGRDQRWLAPLVRLGMVLQGVLVVVYALLRPDQLAWWQVFGLTLRNAAVFVPTLTALAWPVARRAAVGWSMVTGVAAGLLWNAATGFSATRFLLGVHPVWVGTGVAVLVVLLLGLLQEPGSWQLTPVPGRRQAGGALLGASAALAGITLGRVAGTLPALVGPGLFLSAVGLLAAAMILVVPRSALASYREDVPELASTSRG